MGTEIRERDRMLGLGAAIAAAGACLLVAAAILRLHDIYSNFVVSDRDKVWNWLNLAHAAGLAASFGVAGWGLRGEDRGERDKRLALAALIGLATFLVDAAANVISGWDPLTDATFHVVGLIDLAHILGDLGLAAAAAGAAAAGFAAASTRESRLRQASAAAIAGFASLAVSLLLGVQQLYEVFDLVGHTDQPYLTSAWLLAAGGIAMAAAAAFACHGFLEIPGKRPPLLVLAGLAVAASAGLDGLGRIIAQTHLGPVHLSTSASTGEWLAIANQLVLVLAFTVAAGAFRRIGRSPDRAIS